MLKKFGRREQIVVLAIAAIGAIFLVHVAWLGPQATEFAQMSERRKVAEMAYKGAKLLSIRELRELEEENERIEAAYQEAVTSLGISLHEAFLLPELSKIAAASPKLESETDEEVTARHQEELKAARAKLHPIQIKLVLDEVEELWAYHPDRRGVQSGKTEMTFLGEGPSLGDKFTWGWDLPTVLPDTYREEGTLRDVLNKAENALTLLRFMKADDRDGREAQRKIYEEDYLKKLGVDNELYRNYRPGGLLAKGEYVPLIHKLCYATLIGRALEREPDPEQAFTREKLYETLEVYLPLEELKNDAGGGAGINEMYFLYEQLVFLNLLLELAVKNEIDEVGNVILEQPSYLLAQPAQLKAPGPGTAVTPAPTPIPPNPYVLPLPTTDAGPSTDDRPGPRQMTGKAGVIGYSFPVELWFQAKNRNAMHYISDVLSASPLNEIDDLDIKNEWVLLEAEGEPLGQAEKLWFRVRFVGSPFLSGNPGLKIIKIKPEDDPNFEASQQAPPELQSSPPATASAVAGPPAP